MFKSARERITSRRRNSGSFLPPLSSFALLILLLSAPGAGGTAATVYAQAQEKVVAVVNGRQITQRELDDSIAAQLLPLQQQLYALRKTALENLVLRALLEDEAKKRGIPVRELKRQLTSAKVEVQQNEIEKVYAENRSAFGGMSEDEAKERIRLDLESQARMQNYRDSLSKLGQNSRVAITLEEPSLPVADIAEGGGPSVGDKGAPVTIIEFSDFQCPFCKGAQGALKRVLQAYGKNVRLVFKNLPLEMHAQALPAARAAFCAGEQNRFWQYHDALFTSNNLAPETLKNIAAGLGLNQPKFEECVSSEPSRAAVLKDVEEARRLGVDATPTFIINGTFVRGVSSFEDFSDIISRKLKVSQANVP
jgi:protein-disulfide isomerase